MALIERFRMRPGRPPNIVDREWLSLFRIEPSFRRVRKLTLPRQRRVVRVAAGRSH
jgi:hypothetical protein